jgi:hypothetical protein
MVEEWFKSAIRGGSSGLLEDGGDIVFVAYNRFQRNLIAGFSFALTTRLFNRGPGHRMQAGYSRQHYSRQH